MSYSIAFAASDNANSIDFGGIAERLKDLIWRLCRDVATGAQHVPVFRAQSHALVCQLGALVWRCPHDVLDRIQVSFETLSLGCVDVPGLLQRHQMIDVEQVRP